MLYEIEKWADAFDDEDQMKYYFEGGLPDHWKVFRTHNQYLVDRNLLPLKAPYDVGIFLVGFSELPIILSLALLQPHEIYFLYSEDSKGTLRWIADGIGHIQPDLKPRVEAVIGDPQFALLIADSSDPVETFKRIKEVVQKVPTGKTVAIDITGGKKTMNSGSFIAGSIWSNCDLFYIDHLAYDARRRCPVYGTEFLNKLDNPYEVYNVQSRVEAEKLVQHHSYEAAEELLQTISQNLSHHAVQYGLVNEQQEVKNLLEMATCYRFWDALDYKEAQQHKGDWGYQKQHAISGRIDVLDTLSEVDDKRTLFADEQRVIHFATDRYQNALRRLHSGRFEDAIIRFAQVIEILCNYKIYLIDECNQLEGEYGKKVEHKADRQWNLTPLIHFLFGKLTYTEHAPYQIKDSTLCFREDDYSLKAGKMSGFIGARNDFVHVNKPVAQQDAENLRGLSKQFLKNFSKAYCAYHHLSFNQLLDLHQFGKIR